MTNHKLGGWAIGQVMFDWINWNFNVGSAIIEFGSGSGSIELSKNYRLISVEHDPEWLAKTDGNLVVYAPIVDGWYDRRVVSRLVDIMDAHLIIVDGPPAKIGRDGFVKFFESVLISLRPDRILDSRCKTVIFDDTDRPDDWAVAERFMEMANRLSPGWESTRHQDVGKEFTVVEWRAHR